MTAYGLLVSLCLLLAGRRPHRYACLFYFEVGKNWGGFESGGCFVVNRGASDRLKRHEAGHGVQNLIFGPLTPFLVSIPSAVRYWVRRAQAKRGKELPPYDSIWFEGQATRLGEKFFAKNS